MLETALIFKLGCWELCGLIQVVELNIGLVFGQPVVMQINYPRTCKLPDGSRQVPLT